jgi:hypothetical protein
MLYEIQSSSIGNIFNNCVSITSNFFMKPYQFEKEDSKRINLLFNVMWPIKILEYYVDVTWEDKKIQFSPITIERWWYKNTNYMKKFWHGSVKLETIW